MVQINFDIKIEIFATHGLIPSSLDIQRVLVEIKILFSLYLQIAKLFLNAIKGYICTKL